MPATPGARKKLHQRIRAAAIELLGGCCSHCGFSDRRALQFDHVTGNGYQDRQAGKNTDTFAREILKGSQKYQLLCANCNWIKRCVHNEVRHGRL